MSHPSDPFQATARQPGGCTCPIDLAGKMRRELAGDTTLCEVHDAVEIQRQEAEARVEQHRATIREMKAAMAGESATCSCPQTTADLMRHHLEGRETTCTVHTNVVAIGSTNTTPLNAPTTAYSSLQGWQPTGDDAA